MTFNTSAYAAALQQTPMVLKKPLTTNSSVIKMWRKVVQDLFSSHCHSSNRSSVYGFTCKYISPKFSYRLEEGSVSISLFQQVYNEYLSWGSDIVGDKFALRAMDQLVALLKMLPPSTSYIITCESSNRQVFMLGQRQLLQFLIVIGALFKEQREYYAKFFSQLSKNSYPRSDQGKIREVLLHRNNTNLMAARDLLMQTVVANLAEWKELYVEMRAAMGEPIHKTVPSLIFLSLRCMLTESYQPWRDTSFPGEIKLNALYLERTFLINSRLKEEFAAGLDLSVTAPVISRHKTPELCSHGHRKVALDVDEELPFIFLSSLLPNYSEELEKFILKKLLK
ncbi:hypothetical protein CLAVI_000313 [Candidatus Clavichlamydia salmonicola]|uniref:hypothetical protein n=1 Tax=Candidatus Clavichlamydia salmonicola TaxID=469812 RepID=UPI001891BA6A|nr:hypothetical protein [Candidatus Clavichlamydia salmonicola]MBF5050698.1 hypothetical protein [Candidatus Clavichlamydia salmonicola]